MSGYGFKEARINRERHTRVNHCGDCGVEVGMTDLLCDDCKTAPMPEPYTDATREVVNA